MGLGVRSVLCGYILWWLLVTIPVTNAVERYESSVIIDTILIDIGWVGNKLLMRRVNNNNSVIDDMEMEN